MKRIVQNFVHLNGCSRRCVVTRGWWDRWNGLCAHSENLQGHCSGDARDFDESYNGEYQELLRKTGKQ